MPKSHNRNRALCPQLWCVDEDGTKFTNLFLFSEEMLHLLGDATWMTFWASKSAHHAEKVMSQIINYCDYCNHCDYFHYWRLELIIASLRTHG